MNTGYGLYIQDQPSGWRRLGVYSTPTEAIEQFRDFVSSPPAARNAIPNLLSGNMLRGRELSTGRLVIVGPMDRLIQSRIAQR